MKRILPFITLLVLTSISIKAQIGIGTANPDASAALDVSSTDAGLLPPRLTTVQRDAIASPAHGLMVFNTDTNTIDINMSTDRSNPMWQSLAIAPQPTVASLENCDAPVTNGILFTNIDSTGVSFTINYTGGNGIDFSGEEVTATGLAGDLKARSVGGTLADGAGSVTYQLSGTTTNTGTATFAINLGGQSCNVAIPINTPLDVPQNITIGQDRNHYISSVFDEDYLPFTAPTGNASTQTLSPGTNEATPLDIPGVISTSGITVKIPVTVSGSGNIPAFTQTVNVPAHLTEDGVSRALTLSWDRKTLVTSSRSFTAKLTAIGGPLLVKKLDLNAGLGQDYKGVTISAFSFAYNFAGDMTTYSLRAVPAIPDMNYDDDDHKFLYFPTTSSTGEVWLNNNLGANYANVNKSNFNPTQQATASTDHHAYGNLFQWGRYADGHEIINWTSITGTDNTEQSRVLNNVSTTDRLIKSENFFKSNSFWYIGFGPLSLWTGIDATNKVCPAGYRLPTKSELSAELASWQYPNSFGAINSPLKLTNAGYRFGYNGALALNGAMGSYPAADTGSSFKKLTFESTSAELKSAILNSDATPVRCIKD